MNDQAKVTQPQGIKSTGTFREIRNDVDTVHPQDKPPDVPVVVTYRRHTHPLYDPSTVPPMASRPSELLGWSVVIDSYMFSTQVELKLCRDPHRMEVWVDGERVAVTDKPVNHKWTPPLTVGFDINEEYLAAWFNNEEKTRTRGWATKLGVVHEANKHNEELRSKPKVEPTEPHCAKCWKLDQGDLVDKDDKQYCMVCFIGGV